MIPVVKFSFILLLFLIIITIMTKYKTYFVDEIAFYAAQILTPEQLQHYTP